MTLRDSFNIYSKFLYVTYYGVIFTIINEDWSDLNLANILKFFTTAEVNIESSTLGFTLLILISYCGYFKMQFLDWLFFDSLDIKYLAWI